MCGIVGAVAQRDVAPILLEGLKRLEYRGYDSAGLCIAAAKGESTRIRRVGKVQSLVDAVAEHGASGGTGIAHTRWATHGEPNENNAHPHTSSNRITIVHNGIIENHQLLKEELKVQGYQFDSDTDSEVICHLIHQQLDTGCSLLEAVQVTVKRLDGAYGTVVMDNEDPDRLIVARSGSPLVIGYGIGEHFVASDQIALLPVTRRFAFLEEGDVARITRETVEIFDKDGNLYGTMTAKVEDTLASNSFSSPVGMLTPSPIVGFEGLDNITGVMPPDTEGAVGPNHYVQMINSVYAVFDKTGNMLTGPHNNNTLWTNLGGRCASDNDGDPIVLYDEQVDRWVLTQFAVDFDSPNPNPQNSLQNLAPSSNSNSS